MSTKKKPIQRDDREQSKAFIEKAREIGADKDMRATDRVMGALSKTPPQPHTKEKRKRRRPK